MRLYDELIYVNAKGQCSHLLRAYEGKKEEEKNQEEQEEKREEGWGKKLWSQMVLGSNLFSTTFGLCSMRQVTYPL